MRSKNIDVVRGSGNVYRDLAQPDADVLQLKSLLAAEIIKSLDRRDLTVRQAQECTGIAAADFSRIRTANLGRFTVDRLMGVINRLGGRVDVAIKIRRPTGAVPARAPLRSPSGHPR